MLQERYAEDKALAGQLGDRLDRSQADQAGLQRHVEELQGNNNGLKNQVLDLQQSVQEVRLPVPADVSRLQYCL